MEYCGARQDALLDQIRDRMKKLVELVWPIPPGGDPPWRQIELLREFGRPAGFSRIELALLRELAEIGELDFALPDAVFDLPDIDPSVLAVPPSGFRDG